MAPRLQRALGGILPAFLVLSMCACVSEGDSPPPHPEETSDMAELQHVHHGIDYIEFAVADMAAAQRFYAAAFDWEFNDYGPDYAGIRKPGGEAGGLRLEAEVPTGGPLVILYSEDLEQTLARVRAAGGRIVVEPFTFPGGRRFQFLDPSGNELAVWAMK